jgi:hypothetical protein
MAKKAIANKMPNNGKQLWQNCQTATAKQG